MNIVGYWWRLWGAVGLGWGYEACRVFLRSLFLHICKEFFMVCVIIGARQDVGL